MSSGARFGYAPVRGAYFVHAGSTISAFEPVVLAETDTEQDMYESLAEIYSIIVTLDSLEKAYMRDSITDADYTESCSRLLMQYRSFLSTNSVREKFGSLEEFKSKWGFDCPRATRRINAGVPATMEDQPLPELGNLSGPNSGALTPAHSRLSNRDSPRNESPAAGGADRGPNKPGAAARSGIASMTLVVSATENFITLLDAIQMGMMEKDVLHPLLRDIIQSVNKVTTDDFENKGKIVEWLITLNQMKAAERLSEEQSRQFDFDMRQAYHGFKSILSTDDEES